MQGGENQTLEYRGAATCVPSPRSVTSKSPNIRGGFFLEQFENLEREGADFQSAKGAARISMKCRQARTFPVTNILVSVALGKHCARGLPDGLAAVGVVVEPLPGQRFLKLLDQLDVAVGGGLDGVFEDGAGVVSRAVLHDERGRQDESPLRLVNVSLGALAVREAPPCA